MIAQKKAKVGLLGLFLELYEDAFPDLKLSVNTFAEELVEVMADFAEVNFPGVVSTRIQVNEALTRFENNNVDLLLVVLLTYTDSLVALPGLCATKLPILIFNTQKLTTVTSKTSFMEIIENHGLPGVQDLTSVLIRAGKSFSMLTGHYKEPATVDSLREWCNAARVAAFLREARVGIMGYRSEMMGDTSIDPTALITQTGVEITQVSMRLVAERAHSAPKKEIISQMTADRETFEVDPKVTEVEHEAGARLEWALRSICEEQKLCAIAPHFGAILDDGRIKGLPFLASCKLLGDGIGVSEEGDAVGAIAVAMMACLAGAANFTEVFTLDFENDAIFMNHMSQGNWKMARRDQPVKLIQADFPKTDPTTVNMTFALEPGVVTLINLTTSTNGRLKIIVVEGEVVDFPVLEDYHTPNFKFRPAMPSCEFLTQYSLAGGSHHVALSYGRYAATIEKIGMLTGIDCEILATMDN